MFESISVTDPFSVFEPKIPDEFKRKDYFTAPFSIGSKKKWAEKGSPAAWPSMVGLPLHGWLFVYRFIGIDKEDSFFSSAQRIAIVSTLN